VPEAAPGSARADIGTPGARTPRDRIARLQATHGNAALGRVLARFEAGESVPAPAPHARDGLEAEHQASADARSPELDEGPVAQRALASAQSAMASAVGTWQSTASLVGVTVMSVTAIGGQLVGPPLLPLMIGAMTADGTPPEVAIAFAAAASNNWLTWASSVRVPALPWYPSFAAFPGPVAPPMPNVPSPLAALTTTPVALSSGVVSMQVTGMLGARGIDPVWRDAAGAFGTFLERNFIVWQASTMVTNVLGTGPVPSFAPPSVPIGSVVGGTATMPPGGLVGPPFGMV
jgi:hypothetical protein